MKTLFISYCTEYEAGWGQRPDGFIMSEDREAMEEYIKTTGNSGSREYFWRYDEPKEIFCEAAQYKKIVAKLNEDGIVHYSNSDKSNLKLFKQA